MLSNRNARGSHAPTHSNEIYKWMRACYQWFALYHAALMHESGVQGKCITKATPPDNTFSDALCGTRNPHARSVVTEGIFTDNATHSVKRNSWFFYYSLWLGKGEMNNYNHCYPHTWPPTSSCGAHTTVFTTGSARCVTRDNYLLV